MKQPASEHTYPDVFVPVVPPFEFSTMVHEHDRTRRPRARGTYDILGFRLGLGPRARKAEPCTPSRTGMGTEGAGMWLRRPRSVSVECSSSQPTKSEGLEFRVSILEADRGVCATRRFGGGLGSETHLPD